MHGTGATNYKVRHYSVRSMGRSVVLALLTAGSKMDVRPCWSPAFVIAKSRAGSVAVPRVSARRWPAIDAIAGIHRASVRRLSRQRSTKHYTPLRAADVTRTVCFLNEPIVRHSNYTPRWPSIGCGRNAAPSFLRPQAFSFDGISRDATVYMFKYFLHKIVVENQHHLSPAVWSE